MAGLKIKLDNRTYSIDLDPDSFTLGELEWLQDEFGVEDITSYSFLVPKQITGIIAIAVRRAHPELSRAEVLQKTRSLKSGAFFKAFNALADEAASNGNPPVASKQAKTRKEPGSQPSPASTASSPKT